MQIRSSKIAFNKNNTLPFRQRFLPRSSSSSLTTFPLPTPQPTLRRIKQGNRPNPTPYDPSVIHERATHPPQKNALQDKDLIVVP